MSTFRIFAIGLITIVLAGTLGWFVVRHNLSEYDRQETLQPALALLADNQRIMAQLQSSAGSGASAGLLAEFLRAIRSDGLPKHSATRQQIDELVNNNTALVTLLSKYVPRARHGEFRVAAGQYADYAASLRDRWQSVFELFMAGGNLPAQQPVPPPGIEAAIRQELQ